MQNLEEDCSLWYVVHTFQSQGHVAMSQVKKILDWELGDQPENKKKVVLFVVRTDGASTNVGHNREGPTKTAWPWLVALGCFPWLVYQASKVSFRNSCFAQIAANLMSVSQFQEKSCKCC